MSNKKRLPFEAKTVISLLDMITILTSVVRADFMGAVVELDDVEVLNESQKSKVRQYCALAKRYCEKLYLPISGGRVDVFLENVLQKDDCSGKAVWNEFMSLSDAIDNELSLRKLVFVPPELMAYLEQDYLFGQDVHDKFEPARKEIRDAGNCLATEMNTAAVFHLMRVAELGLRQIAKRFRVKIKKDQPIEYSLWGQIIAAINKKITPISGPPFNARKTKTLQYYQGLMIESNAIKDLWRNPVSHMRGDYNLQEALGIYAHVKGFMQRVAEKPKTH